MEKKVEDLITEIRQILSEPMNHYAVNLSARNDGKDSARPDNDAYHEARESVVNEVFRTLQTMKIILKPDSRTVKTLGWSLPLYEMSKRFQGPLDYLDTCKVPGATKKIKKDLKDALGKVREKIEALIPLEELERLREEDRINQRPAGSIVAAK